VHVEHHFDAGLLRFIEGLVDQLGVGLVELAIGLWLQALPDEGETHPADALLLPLLVIPFGREEEVCAVLAGDVRAGESRAGDVDADQFDRFGLRAGDAATQQDAGAERHGVTQNAATHR